MAMRQLNDELDDLFKLHELRKKAKELRNNGRQSLSQVNFQFIQEARKSENDWISSGDDVELALVGKVQAHKDMDSSNSHAEDSIVSILTNVELEDLFSIGNAPERVPVLLAARTMQALINVPDKTFSKATLFCFYRIMREIYTADSPDWIVGGARASKGGKATAFITGECIRAVSALSYSLNRMADFLDQTYELFNAVNKISSLPDGIAEWRKTEIEKAWLNWYILTHTKKGDLTFDLKSAEFEEYSPDCLDKVIDSLSNAVRNACGTLNDTIASIVQFRLDEFGNEFGNEVDRFESMDRSSRSESAHVFAHKSLMNIDDHITACKVTIDKFKRNSRKNPPANPRILRTLANILKALSKLILKIVDPSKRYIKSILHRELANARTGLIDYAELIFAAASYGALTNWTPNEMLKRASKILVKSVSDGGLIQSKRPFHSTNNGYQLHPIGFEKFRGLAQLLQKVDVDITPTLVQRMLRLFEENECKPNRAYYEDESNTFLGWNFEDSPMPRKPSIWVTAVAVLALDRIVRMLDERINSSILEKRYFEVINPDSANLSLGNLIYSDYGLIGKIPNFDKSVAIVLQQMHGHITNSALPAKYNRDKFYSCILYGPPGTGKTTLAEALAKSCNARLVRLSPSDLTLQGGEGVENRARAIFDALSLLSQTVIILDEFEPVVSQKGEPEVNESEELIYSFLKRGMLPKLKALHDSAKERGNVYFLATNHFHKIDPAAKRPGRFDLCIPVFNPDPISRAGYLLSMLQAYNEGPLDFDYTRLAEIIGKTANVPVQQLAIDWFKVPKKAGESNSVFDYVLGRIDELDSEYLKEFAAEDEKYDPKGNEKMIYDVIGSWEAKISAKAKGFIEYKKSLLSDELFSFLDNA